MFEYKSTASQLGYSTLTQAVLAAILDHSYRSTEPFTIAQLKVSPVALFRSNQDLSRCCSRLVVGYPVDLLQG